MILSDISVKRPVLAIVINLLLIAFGILSYERLSLREYPDINPPVVSVEVNYDGASAAIIESRITQIIEDRISGIEGIKTISSNSQDGASRVTIEFNLSRDIDAAANDVRDAIARAVDNMPENADPPEVFKVDAGSDVIMWLNLASPDMTTTELTDYAERYLTDQFSVLDGVARVRVGGGSRFAMRVWLDRKAMAARGITVQDITNALQTENIELPAGRIESLRQEFTLRIDRQYRNVEDFANLVLRRGNDGYLVRLGDVARIERGPEDLRSELRGNQVPMVGIGIIPQSTANTLDVAHRVKDKLGTVRQNLPENIQLLESYDSSIFIEESIDEVYKTLFLAIGLVIGVILLFLGSLRSTIIPAVTVPVSLMSAFIVLYALGFSINLLTLLSLVLAIGLVVDDAIVVLENIYRRIEMGERRRLAAYRGARQVGFAVIATTAVLIAVFVPIAFMQGNTGRLFTEFAFAMAGAVAFSSLVALTLVPVMAAKFLKKANRGRGFDQKIAQALDKVAHWYGRLLHYALEFRWALAIIFVLACSSIVFLLQVVPSEFVPKEDRGVFFISARAPEGTGYEQMKSYMRRVEELVMPYTENGEVARLLSRVPGSFGGGDVVNSGIVIVVMEDWQTRPRDSFAVMEEMAGKMAQIPGIQGFPIMRQGISGARGQPVEIVIGGSSYDELADWRDRILNRARENDKLLRLDADYKETKPQFLITIDTVRAAEMGVSTLEIGRTLETMLASRRVTTYPDRGEEYDVILETQPSDKASPQDLKNIYVRSSRTGENLPLSNFITLQEVATSPELSRFNRMRAVTITADVAEGYTLGEALSYMETIVREELPKEATLDYKGQSREFMESSAEILFVFSLALVVVYLVLAAQFGSFIHPFTILLTVPLALTGALLGLWLCGSTLNIYSQIGMIMLIGLATKNGILMVEFANQLRDNGAGVRESIEKASILRFRPVLMTALSTVIGALPLVLASGPGSESRFTLGVVILFGVGFATLLTLFIIPAFYTFLAVFTQPRDAWAKEIEQLDQETPFED